MENILKKINRDYFLLFLLMFFSLNIQAQWNEVSSGDITTQIILSEAWNSTNANSNSYYVNNNNGTLTKITNHSSVSTSSGTSQINVVYNANGTFASSNSYTTRALIEGTYFGSVNENGVTRTWTGNVAWTTPNTSSVPGSLDNLHIIPYYTYTLPDGQVTTYINFSSIPSGTVINVTAGGASSILPPLTQPTSPSTPPPCMQITTANLSNLVYDVDIENAVQTKGGLPSNVTIVPLSELPSDVNFSNVNTGFHSALYRVDNGNGNIEYVYATAGTDDWNDVVTDVTQAFSMRNAQYDQSIDNAQKLASWAAVNGYTLSFTGHSLGGGLANVNALYTGLKATIYNPAGLSQGTIDNYDFDMSNTKMVTAYVVSGEPVDYFNDLLNTPVRADIIKSLGVAMTNYVAYTIWSLPPAVIDLHLMTSVKQLINCNN